MIELDVTGKVGGAQEYANEARCEIEDYSHEVIHDILTDDNPKNAANEAIEAIEAATDEVITALQREIADLTSTRVEAISRITEIS